MIIHPEIRPQAHQRRRLKAFLVDYGLAALSRGDMATVQWITALIGGSLRYV
jgi:hypothetical protein